jgi:hypothetical protein
MIVQPDGSPALITRVDLAAVDDGGDANRGGRLQSLLYTGAYWPLRS